MGGAGEIDWPCCCVHVPFLVLVAWNEFRNLRRTLRVRKQSLKYTKGRRSPECGPDSSERR